MKKLLSLFIALAFLTGTTGVIWAADSGTVDNSTVSADKTTKQDAPVKKTAKKTKPKTTKKPKAKKKTTAKPKAKKKKKTGTAATKKPASN